MVDTRQIRGWLRILLCALLCIGATLDDIDYINAIRTARTMNGSRGSSMADDDTDDQHAQFVLASIPNSIDLGAPFLAALYTLQSPRQPAAACTSTTVRSGRAPPVPA